MEEYCALLTECLERYDKCAPCDGNSCMQSFYCLAQNCNKGKCDKCLNHIQWNSSPTFHYSCTKITYHYVLRFFNRFASEIAYIVESLRDDYLRDRKSLNVVSLGCGPGSEVYGFIHALRHKAPHIKMNYQGFDLNSIWSDVQQISQRVLSDSPHRVDFFNLNMFGAFSGFGDEACDMLVLNYLLSDALKYYTDPTKERFIEEIAQFVFENDVKNILFNDNSYFGSGGLDTGVGMMLKLIKSLGKHKLSTRVHYRCFPSDNYIPNLFWKAYSKEDLLFPVVDGNKFSTNITRCKSKQILVAIL